MFFIVKISFLILLYKLELGYCFVPRSLVHEYGIIRYLLPVKAFFQLKKKRLHTKASAIMHNLFSHS